MWWLRPIIGAALLFALAGCGFHPLYGRKSTDPYLAQDLSSIHIVPLSERQGQLLHNALLSRLNPDGEPQHPRYQLEINLNSSDAQEALQTDNTATRDVVTFDVRYSLFEGHTEVTTGHFMRSFSYDYLQQQYSNITAAADTQRRAAEEIAQELRNRMAAYFDRAAQVRAQQGMDQSGSP